MSKKTRVLNAIGEYVDKLDENCKKINFSLTLKVKNGQAYSELIGRVKEILK